MGVRCRPRSTAPNVAAELTGCVTPGWEEPAMSQPLRRPVSSRVLAVATGLLVLGASMAAWAPGVGATAPTHAPRALAQSATYGAATSRGRVDVGQRARASRVRH